MAQDTDILPHSHLGGWNLTSSLPHPEPPPARPPQSEGSPEVPSSPTCHQSPGCTQHQPGHLPAVPSPMPLQVWKALVQMILRNTILLLPGQPPRKRSPPRVATVRSGAAPLHSPPPPTLWQVLGCPRPPHKLHIPERPTACFVISLSPLGLAQSPGLWRHWRCSEHVEQLGDRTARWASQ